MALVLIAMLSFSGIAQSKQARKRPFYQALQAFENQSNSQIKVYHYTLLYRNYGSIWFYMCSTVQSPQTVLNGVINLLS